MKITLILSIFVVILCTFVSARLSLADVSPALKPPVILNNLDNPNADAEMSQIKTVIQKEPSSANPVKPTDDDDIVMVDGSAPNSKERKGGHGGGEGRKGGHGGGEESEEEEEKHNAVNQEIKLLEKLIGEGKKIQAAIPEKEARLAALRKKLGEAKNEQAKAEAHKKLAEQQALLAQLNIKIDKLKKET